MTAVLVSAVLVLSLGRQKAAGDRDRAARLAAGVDGPAHGTISGYTNWMCRCDECRAANVEANRRQRERRRLALESGEVVREHGRYSTYSNYGCRCDLCRKANARLRSRRKAVEL